MVVCVCMHVCVQLCMLACMFTFVEQHFESRYLRYSVFPVTCVICCREITYYTVKKGVDFTTNLEKQETELTADMINRSVECSDIQHLPVVVQNFVVTVFLQIQYAVYNFTFC